MRKPLTESVLHRLTARALASYLGPSERFELTMHAGCCLALTGEPFAALNYLVAGQGAADVDHFAAACMSAISRRVPFLAIIFPEASAVRRPRHHDPDHGEGLGLG